MRQPAVASRPRGLCAAAAKVEEWDTQVSGLVRKIVLNAGARENDDPNREDVEHLVVALEWGRFPVPVPVGLEGDLRHFTMFSPAGSDFLGVLGITTVEKHHVGVLGMHPVESGPDSLDVSVVATREGDLGPGWQHHLSFGPSARGDEVAAVDER
jgi:hypothetical protein